MTRTLSKSLAGIAGIIAILTVFSRITGLLRKLAQSWAMADGAIASAYDTANTVPNVLFEITAGGALAGAVIPLISGFIVKGQKAALNQTISALISWILALGVPGAICVILSADFIAQFLFGSAADPQIVQLSAILLQLFAFQIPLYGLSVVFSGALQAHDKFVLPALAPLLSSLVTIGVFGIYATSFGYQIAPQDLPRSGIFLLGVGTTLGVVIFALPQLIPLRNVLKIRFTFSFPAGGGKRALRLAFAGLAALIAQQITIIVIMYSANSAGGVGAYTTFNYAYTVFMVPYAVLAVPVATAVFPKISAAVANQDHAKVQQLVRESTQLVLLFGAASASLLFALAKPAKIVLEVGRDIFALDFAMQMMAGALIGFSLLYHVARVLYAVGAAKLVVFQNTIAWGTVCGAVLIFLFGGLNGRFATLGAIGISFTIGMSCGAIFSLSSIRRVLGKAVLVGAGKLLLSALIVFGVVTWLSEICVELVLVTTNSTIWGAFLAALIGGTIILCTTGVLAYLLRYFKKKHGEN